MAQNILYLAALPLLNLGPFPRVEEWFTLYPDRDFATQFFPDELALYLAKFTSLVQQLRGGRVHSYDISTEEAGNGRVIVRVVQNVG